MRILVTGGGGFLGRAIVRRLVARGDQVAALNRSRYPALEALGVDARRGDIADPETVLDAARGCEAVIHVAAKAGPGLYRPDFIRANVDGTRNVIEACRRLGIGILVQTSSPSVVHAGRDIEGGDESLPYPDRFAAPYPETKALAERMALAANDVTLRTVALRPHLIWGPGDNHLVPRLIARNRAGRLRLPCPDKKIDTVYVDNAASAHLLALDDLAGPARSAGKVYFISNGEPRPVAEVMRALLRATGQQPRIGQVPLPLARVLAAGVDGTWRLFKRRSDPPLSRFLIEHLATAHWFDLAAARRDLGYCPEIGFDQGLNLLRRAWGPENSPT